MIPINRNDRQPLPAQQHIPPRRIEVRPIIQQPIQHLVLLDRNLGPDDRTLLIDALARHEQRRLRHPIAGHGLGLVPMQTGERLDDVHVLHRLDLLLLLRHRLLLLAAREAIDGVEEGKEGNGEGGD